MTNETTPAGVITIKTKSKVNGKQVEKSSPYRQYTFAELLNLAQTAADEELQTFIVECYHLGATSRLRNCINRDAVAQYNGAPITANMLLEMQQQAEANKTNNAEGLAAFREVVNLCVAVAEKAGMSAAGCDKVRKLVSNPVGLSVASESIKGRIRSIVESLQGALDDEALERLAAPLTKLSDALDNEDDGEEW